MSPIPLRIVLHGLIALVPNGTDAANQMTALLINTAQGRPSEVERCFIEHIPMLEAKVTAESSAQCNAIEGCELKGLDCHCKLSRQEVSLLVDPPLQIAKRPLSSKPNSLPFDHKEAGNFSYVANITQILGKKLDPRFHDTVPPIVLAARMVFPFESATACALSVRPDEGGSNVHPLNFRPYGEPEKLGEVGQALAQQVLVELTIPEQATVKLKFKNFDSGKEGEMTLGPTPDTGSSASALAGYRINVSNMRPEEKPLGVDDPCDDGVARDFAYFFQLVQGELKKEDRKIPHVKFTRWKSARDVEVSKCRALSDHAPSSRPICPMASFDPVAEQP